MKNTKICNVCGNEKMLNEFHLRTDSKDGLRNECKSCTKNRVNNYRNLNKEKVNKWNRETYYNNIETHKETKKKYRDNNKEKQKILKKIWNENNKEKIKNYAKERKKYDIIFKLRCNVRSRIKGFLKSKNMTKNNPTFKIVSTCQFLLRLDQSTVSIIYRVLYVFL